VTLEDINYIAQTIGVLAILASLVFVGIQVRQNSEITRAQVHQQISDTFTVYLETMANHSNIIFGGARSRAGMDSLTDEELLRFSFLMAGLFKIWENAFYQYKSGFLDERNWQSNVKWMLTWYHMPGVQTWWCVRKDLFANEFQIFIESSVVPVEDRSISQRLREAAQAATGSPAG
jgi:hypothetical protein